MSSKTQNVGHFVEYRLKRIVNSSSDGAVKASLANLRRGIGTTPGDIPELWELFLQDLPEEMLSRSGVPTHAQWAVYIALTLFALHQQGKDLQKESMYRQENGLGKAVACLILVKMIKHAFKGDLMYWQLLPIYKNLPTTSEG